MVAKKNFGRPRPTVEDLLRALAYTALAGWSVLFLVFPPIAYVSELDFATRATWMGITFIGAVTAATGAVFRFDLKVELPGLIFALIGPFFYFAAQAYLVGHPIPHTDPNARVHLIVYALLPILLSLPRIYALYMESRRLRRINVNEQGK